MSRDYETQASLEVQRQLEKYLKQYIEFMKTRPQFGKDSGYSCAEEYILRHGQIFSSAPLTQEELDILYSEVYTSKFPIKQCFANSQKLAANSHIIQYVEGYVASVIPIYHGWLSINNKVVDLTMRKYAPGSSCTKTVRLNNYKRFKDRVLGIIPEDRAYFGVAIKRQELIKCIIKTKTWGPVLSVMLSDGD